MDATSFQRLAAAVILQAIRDATVQRDSLERKRARIFLRGSDGLTFWCCHAGISAQHVTRWADRTLVAGELVDVVGPAEQLLDESSPKPVTDRRRERRHRIRAWLEREGLRPARFEEATPL